MHFMAFWSVKPGVDNSNLKKAIRKRAEYKFPAGVRLVSEYWAPMADPCSVSVFEANDATALMACTIDWVDYFDVKVVPVEDWQTALQKLGQMSK